MQNIVELQVIWVLVQCLYKLVQTVLPRPQDKVHFFTATVFDMLPNRTVKILLILLVVLLILLVVLLMLLLMLVVLLIFVGLLCVDVVGVGGID
jgi:hypothetical protein